MRAGPYDRSEESDAFDLRLGESTGPEAERSHARFDSGFGEDMPANAGSVWTPRTFK